MLWTGLWDKQCGYICLMEIGSNSCLQATKIDLYCANKIYNDCRILNRGIQSLVVLRKAVRGRILINNALGDLHRHRGVLLPHEHPHLLLDLRSQLRIPLQVLDRSSSALREAQFALRIPRPSFLHNSQQLRRIQKTALFVDPCVEQNLELSYFEGRSDLRRRSAFNEICLLMI